METSLIALDTSSLISASVTDDLSTSLTEISVIDINWDILFCMLLKFIAISPSSSFESTITSWLKSPSLLLYIPSLTAFNFLVILFENNTESIIDAINAIAATILIYSKNSFLEALNSLLDISNISFQSVAGNV